MEPVIIRVHQLKVSDKFKKVGTVYLVITKDNTGIYYMAVSNPTVKSKEYLQHFGLSSQEMVELIERSNFEEDLKTTQSTTL